MIGWTIVFFVLTVTAGLMGFVGIAGFLAPIAQFLSVVFVVLFVASIFYNIIVNRNPRTRMTLP